jgi:hypothetical protein
MVWQTAWWPSAASAFLSAAAQPPEPLPTGGLRHRGHRSAMSLPRFGRDGALRRPLSGAFPSVAGQPSYQKSTQVNPWWLCVLVVMKGGGKQTETPKCWSVESLNR